MVENKNTEKKPGGTTTHPLLSDLRQKWQFASLGQFVFLYHDVFHIDHFDIEVCRDLSNLHVSKSTKAFEQELVGLKETCRVPEIKLRLTQTLSSHRDITFEALPLLQTLF
jgi:hypothetical protein